MFSFNNFDVKGTIDRFELHNSLDLIDAVTVVFGAEHERIYASTSFEGAAPDVARDRVTSGFVQAIVRPAKGLTLTGGIVNLFDKDPSFTNHNADNVVGAGWDPRVADPRGRTIQISARYDF